MKLQPNIKLNDFRLIQKLGSGGMGEVWLAYQEGIDRKVAMKVLHTEYLNDEEVIKRFIQETKNTGKLQHPNIISAFDAGVVDNSYYMAMVYVEGKDLEKQLEIDGIFNEKKALKIIRDIAEALKYAWDKYKIIHRDIKPGNIMIDKFKNTKLMDMGLAKSLVDSNMNLTMTGQILGSPNYMSPEQALSEKQLDCRTDIYGLGVTIYHLVTGIIPFDDPSVMKTVQNVINKELPDASDINPEISKQCSLLIKKMIAKDPNDRHKNWSAVIDDINLVIKGEKPKLILSKNKKSKNRKEVSKENKSNNTIFIIFILFTVLAICAIGLLLFFLKK